MNDELPPESDREPAYQLDPIPADPIAAYTLGYADGRRLLCGQADNNLKSIRARFLAHVDAAQPSPHEQAYVSGVRDAAADNFPSPPHEPYVSPFRHAA
ncbi:MAG TPA: hypothetical protein VN823_01990 [Stellaceae bacterium]|nr:hypothetical protein [Stellaceae bacterium]